MILASEFQRVGTDDFAVIVQYLVDVFDETIRTAGYSDDKIVEINFWNTFERGY